MKIDYRYYGDGCPVCHDPWCVGCEPCKWCGASELVCGCEKGITIFEIDEDEDQISDEDIANFFDGWEDQVED